MKNWQTICYLVLLGLILTLSACVADPSLSSNQISNQSVSIIPRTTWDKQTHSNDGLKPHTNGKITNIVIHHTETPNEPAEKAPGRIASIHRYHTVTRGWSDIAYHYFIAPDGKIYQGRDDRFQTDTGAAYPLDGTLTVSFLGDYRKTLPTQVALDSLVAFLRQKTQTHSLAPSAVSTHGQRSGGITDCPGPKLQQWFNETGKNLISHH